ncbi:MAG: ATP-dependent zinc metalloprotease FtsH [Clostridia bacterium]|nr:ATP-dependent zinc metalloprotease FtsH [Clostridia bacterium]
MNKSIIRTVVYLLVLVLAVILISEVFSGSVRKNGEEISYTRFLDQVRDGTVSKLSITENIAVGLKKDTKITDKEFPSRYDFKVTIPDDLNTFYNDVLDAEAIGQKLDRSTVTALNYRFEIVNKRAEGVAWWVNWIPFVVVLLIMGGFWYMIMRQQTGSNNKVMGFGKSRAHMVSNDKKKVRFSNVAGADEEKEELQEIVEFLKNPKRFLDLGARIPKGVLLVGPPGTGKTLLAKAVAGEAGVPFFSISGSDFVEMFVGVGASRVRDLFDQAKKNSPAIVFIDEIDAVGRHRGAGLGGGHDEREQTLNQLLVEMDGFSVNEGVIILAATNRPDILDPALLRPGRFDRQITVNYPDIKGREEILKVHSQGKPLDETVDLSTIAKRTPYMTGADLENVMNEGALLAARRKKTKISQTELEEAITRVMMGPEKRSAVVTEKVKKLVAYHEAGHAVVGHFMPNCDPVHEVSIVPRGRAGGYTMSMPNDDRAPVTSSKLKDEIAMSLGGNVAELIVLGDISTGSTSDLKNATGIARAMVTEYGMSESIGQLYLGGSQEVFLGRDFGQTHDYSEELSAKIDAEIRKLLDEGHRRATEVINAHRDRLDFLAKVLMEEEKVDQEEFEKIMNQPMDELEKWWADKLQEKEAEKTKQEEAAVPESADGPETDETCTETDDSVQEGKTTE